MDAERIKAWLKNKYNFTFLLIIIAAILFRGYYFFVTNNQPLWWDEASYMSVAKSYAGIGYSTLESIRSSGFPRTMSLFYLLGITNESVIRFFGLYLPAIILLVLTYVLLSKMYQDKRIALIGTVIMAVLWENVFYSNRFHTENLALIFQYLAVIFLLKLYGPSKPKSKLWTIVLLVASTILVFWYRPGNVLFIPAMIAFALIMHVSEFTSTKKRKLATAAGLLALIALFFISLNTESPLIKAYYHPELPISWNSFNVFLGFFKSPINWLPSIFFYTFLIGLIGALFAIYLYFPKIVKEPRALSQTMKSNIFNLLLLLSVMGGFVAFIRPEAFEYRWFFPLLPALLSFASIGVVNFSDWLSNKINKKSLSIFILLVIVFLGAYTQMSIVDPLVKQKASTYSQVKEAGLWLKQNTAINEVVLSTSKPQIAFYSERETVTYAGMTVEEFENFLAERKPHYMMASLFEGNPEWLQSWLDANIKNNRLIPMQGYVMNNQTVAIIYRIGTE